MKMSVAALLLGIGLPMAAQARPAECSAQPSVATHIPQAPFAVPRNGAFWLAYELELTQKDGCLSLIEVRVMDADTHVELAVLPFDWSSGGDADSVVTVSPRIHVDLELPKAPRRLVHRLLLKARDGSTVSEVGAKIGVASTSSLKRLSPPLFGAPWIAVYDPKLARGHRRYVYVEGGKNYIPGRYAIDWFGTTAGGALYAGRGERLEQWYGFGAPVLAVDNGDVVAVRDRDPDRPPHAPFDSGPGTGNLIVLRLDAGTYAFYEHLRRGSIRVREGDKVVKGQVIGSLGNSGHSMTPHLHFHLADGPGPLGSEGIPYLLDNAASLGCYPSIQAALAGGSWKDCPADAVQKHQFPLPNQVVGFPR